MLSVLSLLLLLCTFRLNHGACSHYSRLEDGVCADACLKSFVGACPVGLVASEGNLKKKSCKSQGYTEKDGTLSQKAGPCGSITFDLFNKGIEPVEDTLLATFDGANGTTFKWITLNDPVMGGQSESTFTEKAESGLWEGEVKIVPSLQQPGFCTVRTEKLASLPDVTSTTMLKLSALNANTSALTLFTFELETESVKLSNGTYIGNITIPNTGEWVEVSANWADFELTYRGEPVEGPKLSDQLDQITQIGLSTYFPGPAGQFSVELHHFSAGI